MTRTEEGIHAGADIHAIGATRWGGYDGVIQATTWCGLRVYSAFSDDEFHREYTTEEVRVSRTHTPGCPGCLQVEPSITALWAAQGAEFQDGRWRCGCGNALDLHDAFGTCGRCEASRAGPSRAGPSTETTETVVYA